MPYAQGGCVAKTVFCMVARVGAQCSDGNRPGHLESVFGCCSRAGRAIRTPRAVHDGAGGTRRSSCALRAHRASRALRAFDAWAEYAGFRFVEAAVCLAALRVAASEVAGRQMPRPSTNSMRRGNTERIRCT